MEENRNRTQYIGTFIFVCAVLLFSAWIEQSFLFAFVWGGILTRLGVSQPTVAKMLVRLEADGLVTRRPYRGIFLTGAGQEMARASRARHHTVEQFLRALGVSEVSARIDAEGMEHYVGAETLRAFRHALEAGLATFMAGTGKRQND